MWVSTIAVTSPSAMPFFPSSRSSVASVVEGPGSTSATPPAPCRIPAAMIWGNPRNSRSTWSKEAIGSVECRMLNAER